MLSLTKRSACAACRLRQNIAAKQLARSRWPSLLQQQSQGLKAVRTFSASLAVQARNRRAGGSRGSRRQPAQQDPPKENAGEQEELDVLDEQTRLSKLLYLSALKIGMGEERLLRLVEDLSGDLSKDGRALKVREAFGDVLPEGLLGPEDEEVYLRLYGEPILRLWERDLEALEEEVMSELEEGEEGEEEDGEGTGLERRGPEGEFEEIEFEDEVEDRDVEEGEELDLSDADARLAEDMRASMAMEEGIEEAEEEERDPTLRAHPLTAAGRFATSPSSVQLPRAQFIEPIDLLLSGTPHVHLREAAQRLFGGVGLPNSASTPSMIKTMKQKPIPIDASQGRMSDIDANVFLGVLMPAMYSTIMSVLVETRKRLGSAWAEDLVRKAEAGELRILDAGGAGVGVLAVRELIRAEWERMHEDDIDRSSSMAVAEADGKIGGAVLGAPLGNAVVLTGSDALRKRSAALLENTTFVPRLPDYFHTETARQTGKFDLVIAPHTLFPIREDWARKNHADNLWSLVSADGGLLCMIEKGIARGFESIALARDHILNTYITTPGAEKEYEDINESEIEWDEPTKETGMIVAPCTNHTECPMYSGRNKGVIKGRKDICHFQQRYTRPPFLQKILHAKDKNFEDVKFSYVTLMRGRDLRTFQPERQNDSVFAASPTAVQGDQATDRAFQGYEDIDPDSSEPASPPSSLSLPRQILHPLKRRGHVILDLCTPAGSLERWTVPRSFSKRAFRDARKSAWGDLWALGAKTRVVRTARVGDKKREKQKEGKGKGRGGDEDGEGDGKPPRKALSKRLAKEKRRVKERKAGKRGMLLGRGRGVEIDD